MTHEDFKEYLSTGYRPDPGICQDGGFLVPGTITANKKGFLPNIYRWVGSRFRNRWLYGKGTYSFNFRETLERMLNEAAK